MVEDAWGDYLLFPPDEVPVDGLPWREVRRELPPGAAGTHDVEDRVHEGYRRLRGTPKATRHPRSSAAHRVRHAPSQTLTYIRKDTVVTTAVAAEPVHVDVIAALFAELARGRHGRRGIRS